MIGTVLLYLLFALLIYGDYAIFGGNAGFQLILIIGTPIATFVHAFFAKLFSREWKYENLFTLNVLSIIPYLFLLALLRVFFPFLKESFQPNDLFFIGYPLVYILRFMGYRKRLQLGILKSSSLTLLNVLADWVLFIFLLIIVGFIIDYYELY